MFNELGNSEFNQEELDKIALIDLSEDPMGQPRRFSYARLNSCVDRMANYLKASKYKEYDTIAILATNSYKFVISYLAIRRAGMIPVLVNYKLSKSQIEYIISHIDAVAVLHDREFSCLIPENITGHNFDYFETWLINDTPVHYNMVSDKPALIVYTSGSTGIPKGVIVSTASRHSIMNSTKIAPEHRSIVAQPINHVNGTF
jgi:long-chain acyl-CoA synthetase